MPSIRDVSEILDISESKNTPNKMAYKYIISQVDRLLRKRATDQQYDAVFEVPAMIMYQPNFDRDFITQKIHRHYEKIGFNCEVDVYQITIAWGKPTNNDPDDSDSEDDSETDLLEETSGLYNSIENTKPSESSDEETLPTRNIVVQTTAGPSLSQRVLNMKSVKNPSVSKKVSKNTKKK